MKKITYILSCLVAFSACTPLEKVEEKPAVSLIDAEGLAKHVKVLASDEFEGRAPSSPGETKTIEYLANQFKDLGLSPGNADSYFQEVPMVAITASSDAVLEVANGDDKSTFNYGTDFMAWTKQVKELAYIENSELVFVGYGIVAPEANWNDYEGLDMTGKTAVILVNDPGYATGIDSIFTGKSMTYYGRWTYKYEEAARQGAAGALIIHQTGPAGYPWDVVSGSWSGRQFDLVAEDANVSRCTIEGWITEETSTQLFEGAGLNMQEEITNAAKQGFKSKSLNQMASLALANIVEKSTSNNVIAKIEGKTNPDEYIIYTAHWDHLGKDENLEGDQIYNGAFDNATGVGGLLELAEQFKSEENLNRTIIFLAVTAEEKGLLGSAYYATNPIYPVANTVADINMDGLNIYGPTKDITVVGFGNSELDTYIQKAAKAVGRVVRPDPEPEKGYYYRSDHFSFAKEGIPSLYTDMGIDNVVHGVEWTKERTDDFTANRYHKTGDEYDENWDFSGAVEDLTLLYSIGKVLSNNGDWPNWNDGVAFKAKRDEQRK